MITLSHETEALAQRVADARHVTVDVAVRQALEASAQAAGVQVEPIPPAYQSPEAIAARRRRLKQIVNELAAMPVLDGRSPDAIIDDLDAL